MENKGVQWLVVVIASICLVGGLLSFVIDVCFFLTKTETTAKVISVKKKSGYEVTLRYYNSEKERDVRTVVKFKNTYKSEVEGLGDHTAIVYSTIIPQNVYIIACKVPKPGILIMDLVFLIVVTVAFVTGVKEIKKRRKQVL